MKDSVLSILQGELKSKGEEGQNAVKVKQLRKLVLLSLQLDQSDKAAKKEFKKAVQGLEESGELEIDEDGLVTLRKKRKRSGEEKEAKKRRKEEKKQKKKKKKKKRSEENDAKSEENPASSPPGTPEEPAAERDGAEGDDQVDDPEVGSDNKNRPCKGNPQGITRLFLGNLPFAVDEASLGSFLPSSVTHIKWITDKETGKFYGSAFVEMDGSSSAADAVAMAGSQLMGRPIKINFAPARPGDVWPPAKKIVSGGGGASNGGGGGGGQAGGTGVKAMSVKPENCMKLFIGNLSYDIDDDGIWKFFGNVDAEVKAVRWLHHKDSGDFKGCGFVEFWNTEACEKAATLNGKNLLGRPIRIDWTD